MNEISIYQGSNSPITLDFDVEVLTFEKFSAVLHDGRRTIKSWSLNDVERSGYRINLPMPESFTMSLGKGRYTLEVKIMDEEGSIVLYDAVAVNILHRFDKTILGVST